MKKKIKLTELSGQAFAFRRIILVFGLLVFFLAGCSCAPANKITGSGGTEFFSGSMVELLAKGGNLKCVINVKAEDNMLAGTTYLSGKKARTEMEIDLPGEGTIKTYMITDNDWMYTWNSQYPEYAMKIKISEIENGSLPEAEGLPGSYDFDNYQTKMDYKCSKWIPDNSLFVPPADINFMDFTQTINQFKDFDASSGSMPSFGGLGTDDLCSQCDIMPDAESKEQCLQSLGCI